MVDIDDLLKKPNGVHPSGSIKRKLDIPDGDAAYKAAKLSAASDVKSQQATVDDEADADSDIEAGPELPPEDEGNSDEEGRFFGGGVTRDTRDAMDYLETADEQPFVEERIDAAWARRLVTNLERKIAKNSEQRARHEDEPTKFMASEAELDDEIKKLSILTEHAEFYGEFAKAGGAEQLVSLLAHDNTDIAINAIEIVAELLDEDVEVEQEQWDVLADAMLEADLVNLLHQNLQRLDEQNAADQQGVYHSLAVLEALGSQVRIAERAGTKEVLRFLLARIQKIDASSSQNRWYAGEVLQIFVQESAKVRKRAIKEGGMEIILRMLSAYRKRDPDDDIEEEFMLTLFLALACLVQEVEGKATLIEEEGIELLLIMLREGQKSKDEALRVLDQAMQREGQDVCQKFVEAAGLKPLFGLIKKKLSKNKTENVVDILSALLRFLPGDSPERIRTLAKFSEKSHEKAIKLVEWRQSFSEDLARVEKTIAQERAAATAEQRREREDEWMLRRVDGGAHVVQTTNVILAWLIAEDVAARKAITAALEKSQSSLASVVASLRQQIDEVDATVDADFADMLKALVDAVQS